MKQVAIGVGLAVALFVVVQLAIVAVVIAADMDFVAEDSGDLFQQAGEIAKYADKRLKAAATSAPLPDPPRLTADKTSLEILIWVNIVAQVATFGIVGAASGQSFRGLVESLGLRRYRLSSIWRPALAMIGAYALVIGYSIAMEAIGIDVLTPESTVPDEIVRWPSTAAASAAMIAVGAPVSEEFFFRGLVFGGLAKRGFWLAGGASSALFTLAHFDTGSFIPFFFVGLTMCWLFRSRGTLWDSIIFHFLFNFTSFIFLLAGN